jgi:hypothetical protein
LQTAQPFAEDALQPQIRDCGSALDVGLDRMQHLESTGFGPIASIIVPDVLSDCDASLVAALGSPGIAAEAAHLAALRDSIAAATKDFDEAAISHKVDDDLGFAFRTLDTFVHDVNAVSLAPVVVFDAARLGPQVDAQGGGVRYGIGGGVRLTFMNLLNMTAGYAVNPSPRPWETHGAFFFSLDIVDLFR